MTIRQVIAALENFAEKHGDDYETGVEPMWMSSPPTAITLNADRNIILVDIGTMLL
jgi:hypothetical protein